jgi:hypothetical protein
MAERYDWERERERDRNRDWDRDREREFIPGRWDWDRGRWREARGYGEGREDWGRGREDWGRGREDWRDDWRREGERRGSEYYRPYEYGYGERGNRPEWERNRDWEWGRQNYGQTAGFYGGSMGTYYGESGPFGGYVGGLGTYYGERGRFTGRGPKGWRRSDERIREDVNERLTFHPDVDASEIEVQVKDGEVTLTGKVDERRAKRVAEDIAEQVNGVKDVHNQIRVEEREAERTMTTTSRRT